MSLVDEKPNINILMVTLPLQGHINPMLNFAKRLIPKGVHVTIVTIEDGRGCMLKNAAASRAVKMGRAIGPAQ
jgi:UDP-glucose:(indol-3-yl)acetate beta-D-glucosyltransferase